MANEWNVSYPIDHLLISAIPGELRKLKDSVKDQLGHEHETAVDGDVTGSEHSLGSSVPYEGTSTPTNRPDGVAALANNAIDRARTWWDTNYAIPLLKKWNGSAFAVPAILGAYTTEDDDSNNMLKDHAYLANQAGEVTASVSAVAGGKALIGYIDGTTDPAGAGELIQQSSDNTSAGWFSITFLVAAGEYFEIVCTAAAAPTIRWRPFGTLIKCTDQD